MGVLCIQGAFIEHIAMLHRVAEMRAEQAKILVVDVRKPSQLPDLDGLIIPGGESTTLSVFLKKNDFEEALKTWMFNEEKPGVVWGTCAGLILLSNDVAGQKQGGQVTVSSTTRSNLVPCLRPYSYQLPVGERPGNCNTFAFRLLTASQLKRVQQLNMGVALSECG